jgi:hypothetical protein
MFYRGRVPDSTTLSAPRDTTGPQQATPCFAALCNCPFVCWFCLSSRAGALSPHLTSPRPRQGPHARAPLPLRFTGSVQATLGVVVRTDPCVGTVILTACIATNLAPLAFIMTAHSLCSVGVGGAGAWTWLRLGPVHSEVRRLSYAVPTPRWGCNPNPRFEGWP